MNFLSLNLTSSKPKNKSLFSVNLIQNFSALLFSCNIKPWDALHHFLSAQIASGNPSTLDDDDCFESATLGREEIHQIASFVVALKQNETTKKVVDCSYLSQETYNPAIEASSDSCDDSDDGDIFDDFFKDAFDFDLDEFSSADFCCAHGANDTAEKSAYCASASLNTVERAAKPVSESLEVGNNVLTGNVDCKSHKPSPEAFCSSSQPREETDKKANASSAATGSFGRPCLKQNSLSVLSTRPLIKPQRIMWYYPEKVQPEISEPRVPIIDSGFYDYDAILGAPSFELWDPEEKCSASKLVTSWGNKKSKKTSSKNKVPSILYEKQANNGFINNSMSYGLSNVKLEPPRKASSWNDKARKYAVYDVDDDKENDVAVGPNNSSFLSFANTRVNNVNEANMFDYTSDSESYVVQTDHDKEYISKTNQDKMNAIELIQGVAYMMEKVFKTSKSSMHPNYSQHCDRIKKYKETLLENGFYKNYVKTIKVKGVPYCMEKMPLVQYLSNVIPALLPNLVNIENLRGNWNKTKWNYVHNEGRNDDRIAMRWCDQHLNFYDPFVYRYKIGYKDRCIDKQGLCPYCPIDETTNLDAVFYNIEDTSYLQHLCKCHGVVESGHEVDPPLFFKDWTTQKVVCPTCSKSFGVIGPGDGLGACLISYFNHFYKAHSASGKNQKNDKDDSKRSILGVRPQGFCEKVECEEVKEKYDDLVTADTTEMKKTMMENPSKYLQLRYKKRFLHYSDQLRCEYGDVEVFQDNREQLSIK